MTVFTILICCSRKKGFRHLFTFTFKALAYTDVPTRLTHFKHSANRLKHKDPKVIGQISWHTCTMFTFVYIRLYYIENSHQQDNSWCVYIHTANALKRLRKLQLSYFPCFLRVHGKQLDRNCKILSSVICNNKGPDQPSHPRSLISNFVVCFFR